MAAYAFVFGKADFGEKKYWRRHALPLVKDEREHVLGKLMPAKYDANMNCRYEGENAGWYCVSHGRVEGYLAFAGESQCRKAWIDGMTLARRS
jgi:hypothetical protein